MKITILGCHSATPRSSFHTTSQLIELKNNLFLLDCGEGTQVRLREEKINFSRIKNILISHLHGDHFYGLIGLINTFKLLGRKGDLNIYGPKGIKEIITLQLKLSNSWTNFKLFFHVLKSEESELIFEDSSVQIETIPLKHRVYTNGFLFREKKNPYLKLNSKKPVSYAFCSDTSYYPQIIKQIKNVDLLYHESTFLNVHKDLAQKTLHSTAEQAAKIASLAGVYKLLLGHFSTRYKNKNIFLDQAKTQFENVALAVQGETYEL